MMGAPLRYTKPFGDNSLSIETREPFSKAPEWRDTAHSGDEDDDNEMFIQHRLQRQHKTTGSTGQEIFLFGKLKRCAEISHYIWNSFSSPYEFFLFGSTTHSRRIPGRIPQDPEPKSTTGSVPRLYHLMMGTAHHHGAISFLALQ